MVKVKICGITNIEDALACLEEGVDFLGFIFAKSPRMVSPEKAKRIIAVLPPSVKIAAVFVDEAKERIDRIVDEIGRVDILQFHGNETAEYCRNFSRFAITKAIRVKDKESINLIKNFLEVDFILLDSFSKHAHGGTGMVFDLKLASLAKQYGLPVFLSGGLRPDNVKAVIDKVDPFCVDVASGVEKQPGKKDHDLIREFIRSAKNP